MGWHGAKGNPGARPPAAPRQSDQSLRYQLLFGMTVAFLPQVRILRRPHFIKRGASAVASPPEPLEDDCGGEGLNAST